MHMTGAPASVLAIAVATGRIGYVYFQDGRPQHWGIARKASKAPELATVQAAKWFATFRPKVVVTEKITDKCRKGRTARAVIEAIAATASEHELFDIAVPRERTYRNKYLEADAIADRFPEILPWLPQRPRLWEPEPGNMIYFEAVALAVEVMDA